jgi:glutathione S-transferase
MIALYGFLPSGNVYKVRLLFSHLRIAHRRVEVAQTAGHTSLPAFRRINPMGKVPVVKLDDGRFLTESGAILYYFSQGTAFWATDLRAQTETLRWMFFEQYSHEPPIAGNRYLLRYSEERIGIEKTIEANAARGEYALRVMDAHLAQSSWFSGGRYGIADIALYAYTHVAAEGGFELSTHTHVSRWLNRVRSQPDHISLLQEGSAWPVTSLEEEALGWEDNPP